MKYFLSYNKKIKIFSFLFTMWVTAYLVSSLLNNHYSLERDAQAILSHNRRGFSYEQMVGGTKDLNQMSWVWILPSSIARLTSSDFPPSAMKIISPKSLRRAWRTVRCCRISVFSLFLFSSRRIWKALSIAGLSPLTWIPRMALEITVSSVI